MLRKTLSSLTLVLLRWFIGVKKVKWVDSQHIWETMVKAGYFFLAKRLSGFHVIHALVSLPLPTESISECVARECSTERISGVS